METDDRNDDDDLDALKARRDDLPAYLAGRYGLRSDGAGR
jgi:hypothetical protein